MIEFSVSALDKAPVTLCGKENPEFIGLAADDFLQVVSDMEYELTASKVSGGVLVAGSCQVTVAGTCGRCLCGVTEKVILDDLELFFEVPPEQEILDVSEDVRAELVLEFPMNMLCDDDCRGLCHNCGANLNNNACKCKNQSGSSGDMRWNALDDLKF